MPVLDKIAEKLHLKSNCPKEESCKWRNGREEGARLDNSKITVIFVLGGPGAGMGSQLARPQVCGS
jgi:hypothetical protein